MHTPQQFNSINLDSTVAKLHPNRFPRMSGRMSAIVGFLICEAVTQPAITEIVVTSDGLVLARADGEDSANHFIGRYTDVLRNWTALLALAGIG